MIGVGDESGFVAVNKRINEVIERLLETEKGLAKTQHQLHRLSLALLEQQKHGQISTQTLESLDEISENFCENCGHHADDHAHPVPFETGCCGEGCNCKELR